MKVENLMVIKGHTALRLVWCDVAGIIRCRLVVTRRVGAVCKEGVGMAYCVIILPSFGDCIPDGTGLTTAGEVRLIPDETTFQPYLPHPRHAMVLVNMMKSDIPTEPAYICPRGMFARLLNRTKKQFGLDFEIGFETEFSIVKLESDGSFGAYDSTYYCGTQSLLGISSVIMDEIVDNLEEMGIFVEQFHAESGPGQFEISVTYKNALAACDCLIYTREIIKGVCTKHGFHASFLPKLYPMSCGSGNHMHWSLSKNGKNCVTDSESTLGITSLAESFMASILDNLPNISCFTLPTVASYGRAQPGCWAGAYQCWGVEDRECPLRLCATPPTNFEIKTHDNTANPYISAASVLIAGLEGLQHEMKLPPPVQSDPGDSSTRLPDTLEKALEVCQNSSLFAILNENMGEKFVQMFLNAKKAESELFQKMPVEEMNRKLLHIF